VGGASVEFDRIVKRFGSRTVLSNVSGAVRPGVVIVVTGPNGSGKSTLLNILSGSLRPSSGRVRYLDTGHEVERARWFERLGMAAPDMAVYEELTAIENLRFFARVRGVDVDDRRLGDLLDELGLAARDQRRRVGTYSSGMRQRVKLAQAVVHEPGVLLLDEPSSNLDEAGHQATAALVARFRAHTAVAVATNDPREVAWGDAQIQLGV
jgi:heme exporter protein A